MAFDPNYDTIIEEFKKNGFAIIDNFLTPEEVSEAKNEIQKIVNEMDPADHPITVFETADENRHAKDEYFLTSSDKIRFFYEEEAIDKNGKLVVDKSRAFNKIGHALHDLNPVFKKLSFSSKIQNIVRKIGYKCPEVVQSMYIFKQPKIGGSVTPHFDATFLYVEPIEHLLGLWFPIDDATLENGCLWFIPGSHKTHKAEYRFIRTNSNNGSSLKFSGPKFDFKGEDFVPAPVKSGSCVLIHGLVIHKSESNKSQKSRHAYTFHVVESKNTFWSPENWLQQTDNYKFPRLYEDS